ncbi:PA2778 family cysteine peptidase [Desulfatitalea alkaliphila]|uniref:PA2778 family cysteine peptidase n=1 Tax=Desulfatitalea alkaliphila TaxID=2929485 RepID=A0AA41QYD0_9BACT|nr:PA2778 family cysteine peptidase [Desulfatitalea alkaliphila]
MAGDVRCDCKRASLLLLVLFFLAGCATPNGQWSSLSTDVKPVRVHLTEVPFHSQAALQCGPAALAMTLQWSGVDVGPDTLKEQVFTPGRRGSLQSELISAARRYGRLAYPVAGLGCLLEAVHDGQPVVVLQNLGLSWLARWHYAVVVGYDLEAGQVVLHTGDKAHRPVRLATFERTWRRADHWGLLVLRPAEIPACADETAYLQAALGLQQADRPAAARVAFETAVGHWPGSATARLALGNALYAEGRPAAAIAAFEAAARMAPDHAGAFNNLAHVLAEQGRLAEAEAAARRAVALGGPHAATYRRTLDEILERTGPAAQ